VTGIAPYDKDWLRSKELQVGDHEVVEIGPDLYRVGYILHSLRDASNAWVEVWDPFLTKIAGPVSSGVHAIPQNAMPEEGDGNIVDIKVVLEVASNNPYRFVIWAQDKFYDIYKNHQNKFAIVNQGLKRMGIALITGHYYQRGFDAWVNLLREVNSIKFAKDYLVGKVKNIVAKIEKVGKKWLILPEWEVTVKAAYDTRANDPSTRSYLDFLYITDHGAISGDPTDPPAFVNLLEKLTDLGGSHIVHFWGHACPGIICFPDEKEDDYYFGFRRAKPTYHECIDISEVKNPLNPRDSKPFRNLRVVYLGGCNSFLDPCLPQEFVNKGAKAAVGWKVPINSFWPEGDDAPHRAFWETLCGDIEKKIPGGTVQEAANAAAATYRGFADLGLRIRPPLSEYIGVAGDPNIKLYD
jgi:hypothetical protein